MVESWILGLHSSKGGIYAAVQSFLVFSPLGCFFLFIFPTLRRGNASGDAPASRVAVSLAISTHPNYHGMVMSMYQFWVALGCVKTGRWSVGTINVDMVKICATYLALWSAYISRFSISLRTIPAASKASSACSFVISG
jgi:hypothetical protein